MDEKPITQQESLLLIQQMIETAKREQKDDGKGWIVWGWMLFISSVLTVANLHLKWFSTYFFWNLFGIATIVVFGYETINAFILKKGTRVKTYTRDLFEKLNAGFFISLLIIIVAMNTGVQPAKGFALLISLYAFWILIYGTALNFKPSVIGAYITWGLAIAALFLKSFEWVMVMHGLAAVFGYIIPGHLASRQFRKLHRKERLESV
jgi:hypothetical protein